MATTTAICDEAEDTAPRRHFLPRRFSSLHSPPPLPILLFAVVLGAWPTFSPAAEEIEVASPSGQKISAEVLAYTESSGNVRIKRSDGQIIDTRISVFDEASQEKIIANAPVAVPEFEVDVSIGRKRKRQGDSFYMKDMTVTASVKVTNESRDTDLAPTKFTMLLVGRNSRRYADRSQDWYKVLSVQTFSTELPAGKDSEHPLETVRTSYDSDKDSSNLGGWEYEGYLLVGQDEDGGIIFTKSTLGEVKTTTLKEEKRVLAAIELKEGTETMHDLEPLGSK